MKIILSLISIIAFINILIFISNNILKITNYEIKDNKIPKAFNNYKIVHITDAHSKIYGKNNSKLFKIIDKINPNIIIMSGDMIDGRNSKINETLENYRYLYNKYHVYYGIGNHELKMDSKKYQDYIELLKETGAIVLDDDSTYIYNGKDKIRIFGIRYDEEMEDCNMSNDKKENCIKKLKEKFNEIDQKEYNIFIAHDPENFEIYEKLGPNLIFSGHIHGGLIRFGKLCLLSPRRKLFPKYGYGLNKKNNTTIITSSGLGDATIPIRLFNRPEIVNVILKKQ